MSDKKKLIENAQEETEDRKCPICGNDEWEIGEETYILKESEGGGNVMVACAKCTNCGFVALFAEP